MQQKHTSIKGKQNNNKSQTQEGIVPQFENLKMVPLVELRVEVSLGFETTLISIHDLDENSSEPPQL